MHNIADKIKEEARIAACRAESTKAFVLKQNRDQNQNLPRNSTIPAQPNKASSSVQTTQRFNPYERTPCPPKCVPTPVAPYVYTCVCKFSMISAHPKRFVVDNNRFNVELVDACKTFKTKSYDPVKKLWSFSMDEYQKVLQRLSNLGAKVVCEGIPKFVIDAFSSDETPTNTNDLESLDLNLQETLTQSQKEAVMFGISKRGKCLIADDMGLGKTYTAIALADFFRPSWPLLIVTTASLREMWKEKLQELLPYIGNYKILVQNSVMDKVGSAKIVITSYNLFERTSDHLLDKNFGLIIFDESHQLKNPKAHVTEAAKKICAKAKHIVLLSGTPALSRPIELFTQLKLLDPNFASYMNYTKRYCNGTETQFGYNDKGQSNLQELNILLTKKFMIRRMKSDVLIDLSAKIRETIMLDEASIKSSEHTQASLKSMAENFSQSSGKEKETILLQYYSLTAEVKKSAVCSYVKELLEEGTKFIIFGHHMTMLNAIEVCLTKCGTDFIRIDGTTRSDLRNDLVTQFQNSTKCRVAVLSIQACHAGLTLTAASMVVFAELVWNPSLLHQAESRAHRMGQTSKVVCRYLFAESTADPHIWKLLKEKQKTLKKAGLCTEDFADGILKKAGAVAATTDDLGWEEIENEGEMLNFSTQAILDEKANEKSKTEGSTSATHDDIQAMLDDGQDHLFANLDF